MFGYTRRELLGRNINTLVPEPLATVHQQFMLKYIETGRQVQNTGLAVRMFLQSSDFPTPHPTSHQTVMNTTRTAFGKHSQGYIFPILLNVKAMETSFAGLLQQLTTTGKGSRTRFCANVVLFRSLKCVWYYMSLFVTLA